MASPPISPASSAPQTPYTDPGPSNISDSPSNKRPASTSLSDSEALMTKSTKTPTSYIGKSKRAVIDAYRRRRKKKKLPITQTRPQNKAVLLAEKPASPKGKEREVEEIVQSEKAKENVVPSEENDELVVLRKKVDDQSTLLSAHNNFLQSLAPSITCQICLDPMYRPYTLVPCGHTACYDCLLAWFRAPPAHVGNPPPEHLAFNFDPNEPTLLARDAPMLLRKDKTCPHCRAVVREAPVEAWGIKDIVNHLFAHKGNAAKDLFPSHTGFQEARAGVSGPDAWKGVFRRVRAVVPILGTGGFRHVAIHDDDLRNDNENENENEGVRPFFDEEDGVFRCTECYHEIWDGVCSSCGRLYPGHREEFADEDEEIDAHTWMDAEDYHGLDAEHLDDGDEVDEQVEGIVGALGFHRRLFHRGDEDDSDEEEYESSFIDDEDDHTRMEAYHSAEEARGHDSEDVEMDGVDDEDNLPRRVPPPRVDESDDENSPCVRLGSIEILDSDSDVPVNRQRTQASHIRIDSDDDENASAVSQRAGRVPGPSRGRHAIITDSDSEPEEDERSDVAIRHNQHHYRRPYTRSLSDDEVSLSEEGSDHSSQHESFHGSASGPSHENYYNYTFSDEDEYIQWSE